MAMLKHTGGTLDHILKKYVCLDKKPEFMSSSKFFVAPNSIVRCHLKENINVDEVEDPRIAALHWAKKFTEIDSYRLQHNIPSSAQLVFLNVSTFKSPWGKDNRKSMMKIYNSFSYTQDINYEARILELPLRDRDFKMIMIAPNDVDLLHTLFRRLSNDGLQAAICNIQPLFTVRSKLMAPVIKFTSEETYHKNLGELGPVTISQYGNANVSDNGAEFSVLSSLYVRCYPITPTIEQPRIKKQPFFFGVIYQDTPIFTGQFNYEL